MPVSSTGVKSVHDNVKASESSEQPLQGVTSASSDSSTIAISDSEKEMRAASYQESAGDNDHSESKLLDSADAAQKKELDKSISSSPLPDSEKQPTDNTNSQAPGNCNSPCRNSAGSTHDVKSEESSGTCNSSLKQTDSNAVDKTSVEDNSTIPLASQSRDNTEVANTKRTNPAVIKKEFSIKQSESDSSSNDKTPSAQDIKDGHANLKPTAKFLYKVWTRPGCRYAQFVAPLPFAVARHVVVQMQTLLEQKSVLSLRMKIKYQSEFRPKGNRRMDNYDMYTIKLTLVSVLGWTYFFTREGIW